MKRCAFRQSPEIINPTNFELDPLTCFGSTGVEVGGGSPIDFPNDSYKYHHECAARDKLNQLIKLDI